MKEAVPMRFIILPIVALMFLMVGMGFEKPSRKVFRSRFEISPTTWREGKELLTRLKPIEAELSGNGFEIRTIESDRNSPIWSATRSRAEPADGLGGAAGIQIRQAGIDGVCVHEVSLSADMSPPIAKDPWAPPREIAAEGTVCQQTSSRPLGIEIQRVGSAQ